MKRLLITFCVLVFVSGCGQKMTIGQEQAIRKEKYFASHPQLSEEIKQCIRDGAIRIGMSLEEAQAAWGDWPHWRLSSRDSSGDEIWDVDNVYDNDFLSSDYTFYFHNGLLTHWTQWGKHY